MPKGVSCEDVIKLYKDRLLKKEVLKNPVQIEYNFKPEITKIFGKGGTMEQENPKKSKQTAFDLLELRQAGKLSLELNKDQKAVVLSFFMNIYPFNKLD